MARVLQAYFLLAFALLFVNGQKIAQEKCAQIENDNRARASFVPLLAGLKPIAIDSDCYRRKSLTLGGVQPQYGEFPHHALLGWPKQDNATGSYEFRCGGALISDRYVLTVAHCQLRAKPTVVRLGENRLLTDDEEQVDVGIESIVMHPEFRARTDYNDIALVKMSEVVTFSRLIQPACLWTEPNLNVTTVTVTGFELYTSHDNPDHMAMINLKVLEPEMCQNAITNNRRFPNGVIDGQLCLGSNDHKWDFCPEDSGSAAHIRTTRDSCTYHIVGVASFVHCGAPEMPSIYTRVASYVNWIEEIVWG